MALARTAAIYCRISRDQSGDEQGVQRQEAACRTLADALALDVVHVYVDNDLGASDRTHKSKVREQFEQLVEGARRGDFKYVLAYSNSRLTRRMSELEDLIRLHEATGVIFKTVVSGEDDLSTADGRMVARIKASVDVAEADRISERQKAAFRQRAMRGEPKLQRQRPFGWMADGKTLQPEEATLVREGVQDLIEGHSISTISAKWMERGVLTAAGESEWHWTTMKKVLTGWRTAGVRTYQRQPLYDEHGQLVMGTWEPIISLEERDQALAQLGNRSLKKERQGKWLLASLVRCGKCGGKMYGNLGYSPQERQGRKLVDLPPPTERAPHTYNCKPGAGHVVIDATRLQRYVELECLTHVLNRALHTPDGPQVGTQDLVWEGEARLITVTRKMSELMEAWNREELPDSVVFPQVTKLEAEQSALRRDQQDFMARKADQPQSIRSAKDVWARVQNLAQKPFAERQLLLRSEIEAVVVAPGVRGAASWPDAAFRARVKIAWKIPPVEGRPETLALPTS